MVSEPHRVERYDVLIVGGGVTGLATAELLARWTGLRVKVIDKAAKLGTEASGKLEGWFHTGALFSGADDPQTFLTCLYSLADLVNHYSDYFKGRCNIALAPSASGKVVPTVLPERDGWFRGEHVRYVVPGKDAPDLVHPHLRNDATLWALQGERVFQRVTAAFGGQLEWLREGRCYAPSFNEIQAVPAVDRSTLSEANEILSSLCSSFDAALGLERSSTYEFLRSSDVPMNTTQILRDLAASAIARNVQIETGLEVERLLVDSWDSNRIRGVVCRSENSEPRYLQASLYVFAAGTGLVDLLPRLRVRAQLSVAKSALLVARPALVPMNFVRMSPKESFHFNHFYLDGEPGAGGGCSILGDSGFSLVGNEDSSSMTGVSRLLSNASAYFGEEAIDSRTLHAYECAKTELLLRDDEKRRYSYWIEQPDAANFVWIVPGKFSLFPTVAFQTFRRIAQHFSTAEGPGLRERAAKVPGPTAFDTSAALESRASTLVADSLVRRFATAKD